MERENGRAPDPARRYRQAGQPCVVIMLVMKIARSFRAANIVATRGSPDSSGDYEHVPCGVTVLKRV